MPGCCSAFTWPCCCCSAKPLGALHRQGDGGSAGLRRPHRSGRLPALRHPPRRGDGLAAVRAGHAAVQRCSGCSRSTRCSGCSSGCRSTRRRWPTCRPDSSFNTAVSFVTNTNWQGYGGETTMSYLTQMLGLTVQNFLSAATGIAVVVALIRGFARHSAAEHRQLLGRPVPASRSTILLPLSLVDRPGPGQPGRGAELRRLQGRDDARSRRATRAQARRRRPAAEGRQGQRRDGDMTPTQTLAWARSPRRSPSRARHQRRRLLQRQLGASASRTRRRCPTSSRCWRSS